jgi:hypothetical protein
MPAIDTIIETTLYVFANFNPEIVTISGGLGVVEAIVTSGRTNAIAKNTVTNTVVTTTTAVSNAPTNVDRPKRVAIPNLMTLLLSTGLPAGLFASRAETNKNPPELRLGRVRKKRPIGSR